ncbi:MAG: hypothetical protein JXA44_09540 [Methanospirillaceae archaeon]|nr:hypothetical protein [Methanospirillaceae archaeon]
MNWKQIGIIIACVLFAVVMIVAGMGSSWLNVLKDAKPGNTANIDFTFRDAMNRPIITTSSNIMEKGLKDGNIVFKAYQMIVPVNISANTDLETVPVAHPNIPNLVYFGLTGDEIDAIRFGVTGMKVNEDRVIRLPENQGMIGLIEIKTMNEQFQTQINMAKPGDQVLMPFIYNQDESAGNTSEEAYYRTGTLISKNDDEAVINYQYPTIEIRLTQLNN